MKKFKFIAFSLLICLYACHSKAPRKTPSLNDALLKMRAKFPELGNENTLDSNYYKLSYRFYFTRFNLEVQLAKIGNNGDEVIVLKKDETPYYAIPIFSNANKCYWNFRFDTADTTKQACNTTFEKELFAALDSLDIKGENKYFVMWPIFSKVFQCRKIRYYDNDSLELVYTDHNAKPYLASENMVTMVKKLNKIKKEIFHQRENELRPYDISYWDVRRNRIYQIKAYLNARVLKEFAFHVYELDFNDEYLKERFIRY